MRVVIDTNIFLDVLTKREPFYCDSRAVLDLCESKKIQGFLPASTVTDLFYLVRRQLHSNEMAYKALGDVIEIAKVLTVTNKDVIDAYIQRAKDFEDCLLVVCAKANKCEAIVTRSGKDFDSFDIEVLTPEKLLEVY